MKIKIHQIFYADSQINHLDSSFIPYDNRGKTFPYNYEYAVLFDIFSKTNWQDTDLLGTTSWRFFEKTKVVGKTFVDYINSNPGYDVYIVNPFPEMSIYHSVWKQGEAFHPNLLSITSSLFKQCNYSADLLSNETPPNLTSYCNYWVANKAFWDAYIEFLTPLWSYIKKLDFDQNEILKRQGDQVTGSPYLPFIFERLFSTFLTTSNFKTLQLPMPQDLSDKPLILKPLYKKIREINQLRCQADISNVDRMLIHAFHRTKKAYRFNLPAKIKKIFKDK